MCHGSSASAMKCRMETSSSPVGWSGSISRRVSAWPRMFSGSAQVGLDDRGFLVTVQEGLAVRDGHRVDVNVGHPGGRGGLLGDLVHVALGGDAGPDVQELADAVSRPGTGPPGR